MGENQAQKSDAPVEQIGNGSSSSNKWTVSYTHLDVYKRQA